MSMQQQTAETGGAMAAKASPPLAVVGANFAGVTVTDWVQYATLIYVVLMSIHFIWKWRREIKAANKEDGAQS